jgi:hypothetical protein
MRTSEARKEGKKMSRIIRKLLKSFYNEPLDNGVVVRFILICLSVCLSVCLSACLSILDLFSELIIRVHFRYFLLRNFQPMPTKKSDKLLSKPPGRYPTLK